MVVKRKRGDMIHIVTSPGSAQLLKSEMMQRGYYKYWNECSTSYGGEPVVSIIIRFPFTHYQKHLNTLAEVCKACYIPFKNNHHE